jgi:hypothetical protein
VGHGGKRKTSWAMTARPYRRGPQRQDPTAVSHGGLSDLNFFILINLREIQDTISNLKPIVQQLFLFFNLWKKQYDVQKKTK